jgi:hypothetical protein
MKPAIAMSELPIRWVWLVESDASAAIAGWQQLPTATIVAVAPALDVQVSRVRSRGEKS